MAIPWYRRLFARKNPPSFPPLHHPTSAEGITALKAVRSTAMIRADEIRKGNGQIDFALEVLGTPEYRPRLRAANAIATALPSSGVNLSGSQIFVGLASALGMIGVMVWVVIQLWLFE
jgi:hypothetical protein